MPLNLQALDEKKLIMLEMALECLVFSNHPFCSMITLLGICNNRFIKFNNISSLLIRIENSTLNTPCSDKTSKLPFPSMKPANQYIETADLIVS